jgi:hypothetical protein
MLLIEEAKPWTSDLLQQSMHPSDRAELLAAGAPPLRSLLAGVCMQELRWRGQLVCAFGARDFPGQPGVGIPWMLCTDLVDGVPRRAMAKLSREVVAGWRDQYRVLMNLVHAENQRAVRFVQWLGFDVDPTPCGPLSAFHKFEWRRTDV